MLQVHDHVQLGVQRDSGKSDQREAGSSRQEVRDRTGKLCEIKGAKRQRQCSGLRYIYHHSVSPKYLTLHPTLKHPQPVSSKYEGEITFPCILNFIFFQSNGKTERSRAFGNFSLLLIVHKIIFEFLQLFRNI